MPLRYVDPIAEHGRWYRAGERCGRSRLGRAYVRRLASRLDPWLTRVTGGRSNPQWSVPSATLAATGARSGLPRAVQVAYFHVGDDVVVVASNYGGPRNPQWYHNLIGHPDCEFGGEAFTATEVTDPVEYERLYALAERVFCGYRDYRVRAAAVGRHIPVLRLVPR